MIIDSPGVGEADEMDDMVIQYLPEAFAFIYVANSSLGGGVQKDKVSTWRVCVYFTQIPFEKTGVLSSYFFHVAYNLYAYYRPFNPCSFIINTDLLPTVVSW